MDFELIGAGSGVYNSVGFWFMVGRRGVGGRGGGVVRGGE